MTVDLTEFQHVVGKYVDPHNLLVAAGPLTAASLARLVLGKNKLASLAMTAGTAWFAIKELSGPMLNLMNDQFGTLQGLFGGFRG